MYAPWVSRSLGAERLGVSMIVSFWNLTDASAALLFVKFPNDQTVLNFETHGDFIVRRLIALEVQMSHPTMYHAVCLVLFFQPSVAYYYTLLKKSTWTWTWNMFILQKQQQQQQQEKQIQTRDKVTKIHWMFYVWRPLQRRWAHRWRKGHPRILQGMTRHHAHEALTFSEHEFCICNQKWNTSLGKAPFRHTRGTQLTDNMRGKTKHKTFVSKAASL